VCKDDEHTLVGKATTAEDVDTSGESEVEVIATLKAGEKKMFCPFKSLPTWAIAQSLLEKVVEGELSHICEENGKLRAENKKLCTSLSWYKEYVLEVCQCVHVQTAELLLLSNKLYASSAEWGATEKGVSEFDLEEGCVLGSVAFRILLPFCALVCAV
jgi:hypothetical protein